VGRRQLCHPYFVALRVAIYDEETPTARVVHHGSNDARTAPRVNELDSPNDPNTNTKIRLGADTSRRERKAVSASSLALDHGTLEHAAQLGAVREVHASEDFLHLEVRAPLMRWLISIQDCLRKSLRIVRVTAGKVMRDVLEHASVCVALR
jgi:hypothetical protein